MHGDSRHRSAPVLYDSSGDCLRGYFQWDVNQYIVIRGLPEDCALECHFAKEQGVIAYVAAPVLSDGDYMVYVPNEMFQTPNAFYLYLYIDTPNEGKRTKYEYKVPVRYRVQPSDWEEPVQEMAESIHIILIHTDGSGACMDGRSGGIVCHNNRYYTVLSEPATIDNSQNKNGDAPELYDSAGEMLTCFFQWDLNQTIRIHGLPNGSALECHFAKEHGKTAYAAATVVSDGDYTVCVPNEMFQEPNDFYLYLYLDTPNEGRRTKYEYRVPVRKRVRPENWEEPTPEEKATMHSMLRKAEGWATGAHDGVPVGEDDPAYQNNAKYYAEEAERAARKPYLSLERMSRYLYNVSFEQAPPDIGADSIPGFCSSYVQDGKLYRNLDWNYDRAATFHVFLPGIEGTSFINGLTDSNLDDELIGQLPYHIVDGVNEYGVMVSTHVLYNDWEASGTGEIPLTYLPYVALTRIKSMATITEDLNGVLNNLKTTPALAASGYLIQVLVTDGAVSYVLRPKESSALEYEAVDISENPKLANFLWVPDQTVAREDLQDRPTGVERWNMMPCPLPELRFTKCYEAPTRLSEFIGINNTSKDSTDAELAGIYESAHGLYETRERDGVLWQTMHSVVYSANGMEHLWIQENWSKDYIAAPADDDLVGDKTYTHCQLQASDAWTIEHGLEKYPSVSIVDSGGSIVVGEVTYIDENRLTVYFTSSFSGMAYLN